MSDRIRFKLLACLLGSLLLGVGGCTLGAGVLKSTRPAYNRAIQRSANEEMLLNLLRVRYGEPVQFLQIGSVVSSFNFGADLGVNGVVPFGAPVEVRGPKSIGGNAGVNYLEAPTVTFTPLEGQEFLTQMLTESSVDMFLRLVRSGWAIERVMMIMVERIGALFNNPVMPAEFERFMQLVRLWGEIQARGNITFETVADQDTLLADNLPPSALTLDAFTAARADEYILTPQKDGKFQLRIAGGYVLVMKIKYANRAEADQAKELLGLSKPNREVMPDGSVVERLIMKDVFGPSPSPPRNKSTTEVKLTLRSFFDQLFYVAFGIPAPPGDEDLVSSGTFLKGKTAQGSEILRQLASIRHSESRPDNALVAVPYRGHWFFIDDQNWAAKSTFQLLTVIFALQSQGGSSSPSLTLPIGQ